MTQKEIGELAPNWDRFAHDETRPTLEQSVQRYLDELADATLFVHNTTHHTLRHIYNLHGRTVVRKRLDRHWRKSGPNGRILGAPKKD